MSSYSSGYSLPSNNGCYLTSFSISTSHIEFAGFDPRKPPNWFSTCLQWYSHPIAHHYHNSGTIHKNGIPSSTIIKQHALHKTIKRKRIQNQIQPTKKKSGMKRVVWVGFGLFPRLDRNTLESSIYTIQNKYNSNSRTMGGKKIRGEKERLWNAYLRSRADLMRNALALLNE